MQGVRTVNAREEVDDVFTVWIDSDRKEAGIDPDSFAVQAVRNAQSVAASTVGITSEIAEVDGSPGDYAVKLVFSTQGYHQVEVAYAAGQKVFAAQYDVQEPQLVMGRSAPEG